MEQTWRQVLMLGVAALLTLTWREKFVADLLLVAVSQMAATAESVHAGPPFCRPGMTKKPRPRRDRGARIEYAVAFAVRCYRHDGGPRARRIRLEAVHHHALDADGVAIVAIVGFTGMVAGLDAVADARHG